MVYYLFYRLDILLFFLLPPKIVEDPLDATSVIVKLVIKPNIIAIKNSITNDTPNNDP